jgi:DNA-binding IclR family transcriptional regulator
MTTHELLDYLRSYPLSTFDEIENYFTMSQQTVSETVVNLKRRGLIMTTKVINGNRGRPKIKLELTELGYNKLDWYDNNSCPRFECACKERK